jgi:hypothetical protein
MTSRKSKQERLEQSKVLRAKQLARVDPWDETAEMPAGAVAVDPSALSHNNTYSPLPRVYVDTAARNSKAQARRVHLEGVARKRKNEKI